MSKSYHSRRQAKKERNRAKRNRLLHQRKVTTGTVRNLAAKRRYVGGPISQLHQKVIRFLGARLNLEVKKRVTVPLASGTTREIDFPELFSFIEAPDRALSLVQDAIQAAADARVGRIHVNQAKCVTIDYGAGAVATSLLMAASRGFGVRLSGTYPEDEQAREIVAATGLPREVGVDLPNMPNYYRFPLLHSRSNLETSAKSTSRDRAVVKFVTYINQCFRTYGKELTKKGKWYLAGILGEVIENAETHSAREDWWIGGYLRSVSGRPYGDCHVTIFNYGRTIHESLSDLPKTSRLRQDMKRLSSKHSEFSFWGSDYGEEQLWTLYALQSGVSRFNEGDEYLATDRGQGLANLVTFFQLIGQSVGAERIPRMSVISGSTQILFDNKYRMERVVNEHGEPRHLIAFNPDNDLEERPDPRNVIRLKGYFPGTVVSLRFYFDPAHLSRLSAGPSDDNATN